MYRMVLQRGDVDFGSIVHKLESNTQFNMNLRTCSAPSAVDATLDRRNRSKLKLRKHQTPYLTLFMSLSYVCFS